MINMNLYRSALWLGLLFVLISCEFGNTNIDPTRPRDAELKELLPAALTQTTHNLVSIGGRVTGTVVQHFKGLDAQPASYSQYIIDERTLDDFWRTGLYGGAMRDCHLIIEKAAAEEYSIYAGIAKILMAINLNIATTLWGDVPYKKAFGGVENLQPSYDSQEEIFESIHILLVDAIDDLNKIDQENAPAADDLIFSGDRIKWIATAKALQARYYLQQSNRKAQAPLMAMAAIQSGVFESPADQPDFNFGINLNEAHPLPLYSFERPGQLIMGEQLYDLLTTTQDPRLSAMTRMVDGLPLIYQPDSNLLYWGQFDVAQPLISLAEIKFIEAEALLLMDNVMGSEQVFKEAVAAHMQQMKIDQIDYQPFVDDQINYNNSATKQQKIKQLHEQKHIALFGQNSIESWMDYRRTGFPQLRIPAGANSSFNPSLVVPRRYLYPVSERNSNEQNLQQAIQRQGGQLMDVDLWIFGD